MRTYISRVKLLPLGVFGLTVGIAGQGSPLTDIYKTGQIRLVEEVRVTDKHLPNQLIFENPRGLTVDANNNVYVADFNAGHIKVFNPSGRFLRIVGSRGSGPGELSGPECIAIAGNRIIVFEAMNLRLSVLELDGTYIRSVPLFAGTFGSNWKVMALPDGRPVVYLERGLPEDFRGKLPDQQVLAVDVISEDLKTRQTVYEKQLRSFRWAHNPLGNTPQRVRFPYHPSVFVDVSASGVIAAGFNQKYEIQLFGTDLRPIKVISRPFSPIRCGEKDKKAYFESFRMAVISDNVRTIVPKVPDFIMKFTEFPEFLPPYRGLIFDSEGNLWIHLFTPNRATNVFDIFSTNGEFIGKITIEGAPIDDSFTLSPSLRLAGINLWRIERDADGFSSLVKYRLAPGK